MSKRFFSPSTGGFYSEAIHGARKIKLRGGRMANNTACSIPADAVAVTDERFAELMDAQATGQTIAVAKGKPVAITPEADDSLVEAGNRARRNILLAQSDWTQLPDSPLDEPTRDAWAAWRQQLRDLDLNRELADADWPIAPGGDA